MIKKRLLVGLVIVFLLLGLVVATIQRKKAKEKKQEGTQVERKIINNALSCGKNVPCFKEDVKKEEVGIGQKSDGREEKRKILVKNSKKA